MVHSYGVSVWADILSLFLDFSHVELIPPKDIKLITYTELDNDLR